MRETPVCTAADAIYKLAAGNLKYLNAENGSGDISRRIRMSTWAKGQSPYAIIVTCSDSRVIPENIFSAGIGELFVIRLAGNIIDDHQLGSIEYAAGHLGCRLVVVLGHTHCGAVDAAINHEPSGYIRYITDEIKKAIGDETDPYKASCLNVRHSVQEIEKSLCIHNIEEETGPAGRRCDVPHRGRQRRIPVRNSQHCGGTALSQTGKGPFLVFDNPASFAYTDSGKRNRRRDGIWYR